MPNSNSQSYRIRNGECLERSTDQKLTDYSNNKRYCKEQGLSPTTSKNTAKNTYRKTRKADKQVQRRVSQKTVRFKSASPHSKQSGGFRKKNKTKTKKMKRTKRCGIALEFI